jgi:predicted GNAT superfamily acetyltransferase
MEFLEIEGVPDEKIMRGVIAVYQTIFGNEKAEKITQRLTSKTDCYTALAIDNQQVIGFKIGYQEEKDVFYSWLGGVLPDYRGHGIATELMLRQHAWCQQKGYSKIRTKTMNRWRSMLILNLKMGFEIVETYQDEKGILKIILEKKQ